MRNLKYLILITILSTMLGCKPDMMMSTQEKFERICTDSLSEALESYAKYDGWSVDEIKYYDVKYIPDLEKNSEYKTDQFYSFTLLGKGVRVKNGYGVLSNSIVKCEGTSSLIDGEYTVPINTIAVAVELDGRRIDTYGQLERFNKLFN